MKFLKSKYLTLSILNKTAAITVLFFFFLVTLHDGLSVLTHCNDHKVELNSNKIVSYSSFSNIYKCDICVVLKNIANQFILESQEINLQYFKYNTNIFYISYISSFVRFHSSGRSPPLNYF